MRVSPGKSVPQTSSRSASRRQDDAGVPRQCHEQVEFARPQLEAPVADGRLAPAWIDSERAHLDRTPAAVRRLGATQDGLDASDESPRVERLGDVIVGAELEADDGVDVVARAP